MVTVSSQKAKNTGTALFELVGLSGDTKPTGAFSGYQIAVNSIFLELDTMDLYYFTGTAWAKAGG